MRWNTPEAWAISQHQAHPALVTEADFVAVQHIRAAREVTPGRTYRLAGLLRCGLCGRRMDAHWAHQRPGYRCRHGHTSASAEPGRPRNAHVREDRVLDHLPALVLQITACDYGVTVALSPPSSTSPPTAFEAVEHLRINGITLAYDPAAKTLIADTERAERILIG